MAVAKSENRQLLAYKSNQIICIGDAQVKQWDELSSNQLKLAMYSASKVKLEDTQETVYTMTFQEFAKLCCYEETGGKDHKRIFGEARKLSKLGVDFIASNGDLVGFNWINSVRVSPKSGTLTYNLDKALLPFYKTKKGSFAIINLLDYMPLRGRYALLLYEFLAKWQNSGKVYQAIEDIRSQLRVPYGKYKRPYDLMTQIVDRAVEEINEKVECSFHVRIVSKRGKRSTVEGVTFYIDPIEKSLTPVDETVDLLKKAGVDPATAKSIIDKHSPTRILKNIEYAKGIERKGKIKTCLAAMAVNAIEQDYAEVEQLSLLSIEKTAKKKAEAEVNISLAQLAAAKMEEEERAAADIPIDPDSPYARIAKKAIGELNLFP